MSKTVFQGFIEGTEYTVVGEQPAVEAYVANKILLGIQFDDLSDAEVELEIANANRMERTVIILS